MKSMCEKQIDYDSMSTEELWDVYEQTRKTLAAKIVCQHELLERRLSALNPSGHDKARRSYPVSFLGGDKAQAHAER